jgi:hypothetical protein
MFRARHSHMLFESCDLAEKEVPQIKIPILVTQGGQDKLTNPKGAKVKQTSYI